MNIRDKRNTEAPVAVGEISKLEANGDYGLTIDLNTGYSVYVNLEELEQLAKAYDGLKSRPVSG